MPASSSTVVSIPRSRRVAVSMLSAAKSMPPPSAPAATLSSPPVNAAPTAAVASATLEMLTLPPLTRAVRSPAMLKRLDAWAKMLPTPGSSASISSGVPVTETRPNC